MTELQKQENYDYLTSSITLHMVSLSGLEKKLGGVQTGLKSNYI